MTDDANFCGGRLRLAAFLRVVEGDMPGRPSRFRRRHIQSAADVPVDPAVRETKIMLDVTKAAITPPVPRVSETKKSSTRSREPPRTRKRKLPVNSLALLRTTTSDGLPEPGDAHRVFANPITATDPIDDSQLDAFAVQHLNAGRPSEDGHMLQQCRTDISKQPRNPNTVPRALPILHTLNLRSQPHLHIHPMADGFVGSELQSFTIKKPPRKDKPVPRKAKPHATATGLELASGLLPASAVHRA